MTKPSDRVTLLCNESARMTVSAIKKCSCPDGYLISFRLTLSVTKDISLGIRGLDFAPMQRYLPVGGNETLISPHKQSVAFQDVYAAVSAIRDRFADLSQVQSGTIAFAKADDSPEEPDFNA